MINFLKTFALTLVLLFILVGFALYIGWSYGKDPGTYVNTNSATVLKEIRELQRLETAVYSFEKIIDAGTTGGRLNQILFGDKLLLIANGEVIAGFDLSKIQDDDVSVTDKNLTVRLPAPEILVSKLDSEKTRVYDRSTGVLTKGNKDLESQARAEAEKSIRLAACESDILKTASDNGRKQLTALFSALDFQTVTIETPEGSCE